MIVRLLYDVAKIVWLAPLYVTELPELIALSVLMPTVPFSVRFDPIAWVKSPVPLSALLTVRLLLLINVTPVTVTFGIVSVPRRLWVLVSNVYTPEPAVNVPLFAIPLWKLAAELPLLFHVADDEMVTSPAKVLVPDEEVMARVDAPPDPTVVVPVTEKLNPPTDNEVPLPTVRFPPTVVCTAVEALVVPEVIRLFSVTAVVPPMVWVVPFNVNVPVPGTIVAPLLVRLPARFVAAPAVNVPKVRSMLPDAVKVAGAVKLPAV